MRNTVKGFALIIFLSLYIGAHAQDTTLSLPKVLVENGFVPNLAPANKVTTPPVAEAPTAPLPSLSYSIIPVQFITTSRLDIPVAIQMGKNQVAPLKNNHIRLGFGNYTSPLAELYLHNVRDEYGAYGLTFKHLSANGPDNAKFSDNLAKAFGKRFFKKGTLMAGVDYARNAVRFYGVNDSLPKPSDDSTKQVFQTIGVNGGWESSEWGRNKSQFGVNTTYYNLTDKWGVQENDLLVGGNFKTLIKKDELRIHLSYNYNGYKDSGTNINRNFINIKPRYTLNEKGFKLALGFNSTIYKDTAKPVFYFFPAIEGEYEIEKQNLLAIAGISGNLQKNTFRSYMTENPFMGNKNSLNNTVNRLEVYAGIRGKASENFGFTARLFYNSYNDMPVFIADSTVLRRFKPLYIDAKVIRFNVELGYQYSEKVRINLTGNFYNYKVADSAQKAWQMPTAEVKLNATYNIGNKLMLTADVFLMNQRPVTSEFAKTPAANLKAFTDFNIGLEYRYRKTLSLFARLNNVSSVRYQRWYNHPVLGLNAIGGITFSL